MKFLFITFTLALPLFALATENNFMDNSFLTKVFIERNTQPETCGEDANATLVKIIQFAEASSFGWPSQPVIFSGSGGCRGNVLLASKHEINVALITQLFAESHFTTIAIVKSSPGVFMGLTAIQNTTSGIAYCERKNTKLQAFPTWQEGFKGLDQEMQNVMMFGISEKEAWLNENFKCSDLQDAQSVDIVFDVANSPNCPLNSQTHMTCFINRGFQKYSLSLGH